MEKFPTLAEGQAALIRAEFNTGIVLDDNYTYAVRDDQKVYTIFGAVEDALMMAQEIIEERHDVECVVYDRNHTLIKYITPK